MSENGQKKSLGGCEPAGRPKGSRTVETIRSFIVEGRDLDCEDYRFEIVPMVVPMSSAAISGSVTFRALKTFNFMIGRIAGLLDLQAPMDELLSLVNSTDGTKGVGSPTVTERRMLKAMNCTLALQNSDRTQAIFDQDQMPLSRLLQHPVELAEAPHILKGGETLQLDAALVAGSTNVADDAAVAGALTNYGVSVEGWYVRTRTG